MLPPYKEEEYEPFDDTSTVPTYHSITYCSDMLVIHVQCCKSKQIHIHGNHNKVLSLHEDQIDIPLKHPRMDIAGIKVKTLDGATTIVVPILRKKNGISYRFNRFRFSQL